MAKLLEASLRPGTQLELSSQRTRRRVGCTVGELIGQGGSAKVYAGTLDQDGTQIVLKCQRFAGDLDPALELEISLYRTLSHRNIVHCVGVGATRQGQIVLGFRRCYGNPLLMMGKESVASQMRRDAKAVYPHLPMDTSIDLGYELLRSLRYLERQGLVHHDVKLANLMIDVGPSERELSGREVLSLVCRRKYRGVLIDFGATRTREEMERFNSGDPDAPVPQVTPLYAPPEAVVERRRDDGELGRITHPSLDVYAAALVIYAMVTGHPPYSHLKNPPDLGDLESIVSVKSAEGRGEIETISMDNIRRVVFDGERFADDRAAFDLGFYRFLTPRLSPDPLERGTITDMLRDFERLMRIDDDRSQSGVHDVSSMSAGVHLPFGQKLVEPSKRGEHPLLLAARLYKATGAHSREAAQPDVEETQRHSSVADQLDDAWGGEEITADEASGLVFVSDAGQAKASPEEVKQSRKEAKTKALSRADMARQMAEARERAEERERAAQAEAEKAIRATSSDSLPSLGEERSILRFTGSAFGLTARALTRSLFALLSLPVLVLAIAASGLLEQGPGALLVLELEPRIGAPSTWPVIGEHWTRHGQQALAQPAALWAVWVVLLLCVGKLSDGIRRYRLANTEVFGQPLVQTSKPGLVAALYGPSVLILTLGLGAPWVICGAKRRAHQSYSTSDEATLDFGGRPMQVLGLLILTLLGLPLAVVTLGWFAIPLSYAWRRWEQASRLLPDPSGRLRTPRFTGSLTGYLGHAALGWIASVLSLGLLRPWATVRTWRWFDRHTVV